MSGIARACCCDECSPCDKCTGALPDSFVVTLSGVVPCDGCLADNSQWTDHPDVNGEWTVRCTDLVSGQCWWRTRVGSMRKVTWSGPSCSGTQLETMFDVYVYVRMFFNAGVYVRQVGVALMLGAVVQAPGFVYSEFSAVKPPCAWSVVGQTNAIDCAVFCVGDTGDNPYCDGVVDVA